MKKKNEKTLDFSPQEEKLFSLSKKIPFTYIGLLVRLFPKETKTVLDMGCGNGAFMKLIDPEGKYQIWGVEVFPEYVRKARKSGVYKKVFQKDVLKFSTKKKYDVVFLSHVVEHLPKNDARNLLKRVERMAKKRIIVVVPNGEYPQEEYDNNPYQQHKSSWDSDDFRRLGYKVIGQGWKILYKNRFVKYLGKVFYFLFFISTITQPLLYIFPEAGLQIICYKDLNK